MTSYFQERCWSQNLPPADFSPEMQPGVLGKELPTGDGQIPASTTHEPS